MQITPGSETKTDRLQQQLTKPCQKTKNEKTSLVCFQMVTNENIKD